MQNVPAWIFPVFGLVLSVPLFWTAVLWAISRSGWRALAERHAAPLGTGQDGARRFMFQTVAALAGGSHANYKSVVTVTVGPLGISLCQFWLFRPFHPGVHLPWSEIAALEQPNIMEPSGVLIRTRDNMGVFLNGAAGRSAWEEWRSREGSDRSVTPSEAENRTDPLRDKSDRDRLILELGRSILQDSAYAAGDWRALALVFTAGPGELSIDVVAYLEGRSPTLRSPADPDPVRNAAVDLRAAMRAETGSAWTQMLYQVWFPGPDFRADFSYEDTERWPVHGRDVEDMRDVVERIDPARRA